MPNFIYGKWIDRLHTLMKQGVHDKELLNACIEKECLIIQDIPGLIWIV